VSELLYAGKTPEQIAGYTPWTRMALFYPRDQHGRLKRRYRDLPEGVEVDANGMRVITGPKISLKEATYRANRELGLAEADIDKLWQKFLDDNPLYGKGGLRGRMKRGKSAAT